MNEAIVNKIISYGVNALIGMFGGIISYIYSITKGHIFSFVAFCIQAFIGGFVTLTVNEFIPADWDIRVGLLFICGFLSTKILDVVQDRGVDILIKKYIDKDHIIEKKIEEKPLEEEKSSPEI